MAQFGFEAVPVAEGRNPKNFAAWGDHRAYMEKMYADGLAFLRREIQKLDPDAYVGMEGSACGDIELTMGQLEYYGPYSHCVNDEVMRSLGKARAACFTWDATARATLEIYRLVLGLP